MRYEISQKMSKNHLPGSIFIQVFTKTKNAELAIVNDELCYDINSL